MNIKQKTQPKKKEETQTEAVRSRVMTIIMVVIA